MVSLGNFLTEYGTVLTWALGLVVFLGFMKGFFTVVKAIWKFFRKGVYDI